MINQLRVYKEIQIYLSRKFLCKKFLDYIKIEHEKKKKREKDKIINILPRGGNFLENFSLQKKKRNKFISFNLLSSTFIEVDICSNLHPFIFKSTLNLKALSTATTTPTQISKLLNLKAIS